MIDGAKEKLARDLFEAPQPNIRPEQIYVYELQYFLRSTKLLYDL